MNSRLAILCPGQGGQHPAMFDLARSDRRAQTLLEQWDLGTKLAMPLDQVLRNEQLLFSNHIAQPLIVAASMAIWEAIKHAVQSPTVVAGYSIGELTAYGVAEALLPSDAVGLAVARAKLMDACLSQSQPQSLVAVSGLDARKINDLVPQYQCFIAIETAEDSFIIGGLTATVADLSSHIIQLGARISPLAVEIASHTPLMHAAVQPFYDVLNRSRFQDPKIAVLSGISAESIRHKGAAISALSRQLAESIKWKDCMDACVEDGITTALELGPGSALSRMLQARHPTIECRSVADFRSIDGIVRWLERH